ncbi:hypothetical protein ACGF5M_04335 [Gemmatimonadota bacterium]
MRIVRFFPLLWLFVGCVGQPPTPTAESLGVVALAEVWPEVKRWSGFGEDTVSAVCITIAEDRSDLSGSSRLPQEGFLEELEFLGVPSVPMSACRLEQNQVWHGDSELNAYGVELGPLDLFLPDSVHLEILSFIDGVNATTFRCAYAPHQRNWELKECHLIGVS